jgi:hypothetical protein
MIQPWRAGATSWSVASENTADGGGAATDCNNSGTMTS